MGVRRTGEGDGLRGSGDGDKLWGDKFGERDGLGRDGLEQETGAEADGLGGG